VIIRAFAVLVFLSASVLAQPAALRIVVIEGEDGVNVIQQNTAVRPVVEVRDRNNLPVPGVLVTFSIEGGKAASFGGASTLTVATNAAGQAAVSGLTPTAAGAFQIQVQAAFQGQIATATIAQTNVMTAAQAAAASGASGSGGATGGGTGAGGAAGGGGGLSATTIGVVGAAVGGGALVATQINKEEDGGERYTGTITGQLVNEVVGAGAAARCSFTRTIPLNLTLTLDVNTETSVRGALEVTGSDTVIAQTCSGPRPATPLQERLDVARHARLVRVSTFAAVHADG